MPQSKNKLEPEMPPAQKASDHQYAGLISIEGIEPELQSLGTESISRNEDSARRDNSFDSEKKFGLHDYFVSKEWHGPYVEAVCGTDEIKREAIIAVPNWTSSLRGPLAIAPKATPGVGFGATGR